MVCLEKTVKVWTVDYEIVAKCDALSMLKYLWWIMFLLKMKLLALFCFGPFLIFPRLKKQFFISYLFISFYQLCTNGVCHWLCLMKIINKMQEPINWTWTVPCCFLGKMFPTQGDLHVAPFTDETLYMEQCSKANFWSVSWSLQFRILLTVGSRFSVFLSECCTHAQWPLSAEYVGAAGFM